MTADDAAQDADACPVEGAFKEVGEDAVEGDEGDEDGDACGFDFLEDGDDAGDGAANAFGLLLHDGAVGPADGGVADVEAAALLADLPGAAVDGGGGDGDACGFEFGAGLVEVGEVLGFVAAELADEFGVELLGAGFEASGFAEGAGGGEVGHAFLGGIPEDGVHGAHGPEDVAGEAAEAHDVGEPLAEAFGAALRGHEFEGAGDLHVVHFVHLQEPAGFEDLLGFAQAGADACGEAGEEFGDVGGAGEANGEAAEEEVESVAPNVDALGAESGEHIGIPGGGDGVDGGDAFNKGDFVLEFDGFGLAEDAFGQEVDGGGHLAEADAVGGGEFGEGKFLVPGGEEGALVDESGSGGEDEGVDDGGEFLFAGLAAGFVAEAAHDALADDVLGGLGDLGAFGDDGVGEASGFHDADADGEHVFGGFAFVVVGVKGEFAEDGADHLFHHGGGDGLGEGGDVLRGDGDLGADDGDGVGDGLGDFGALQEEGAGGSEDGLADGGEEEGVGEEFAGEGFEDVVDGLHCALDGGAFGDGAGGGFEAAEEAVDDGAVAGDWGSGLEVDGAGGVAFGEDFFEDGVEVEVGGFFVDEVGDFGWGDAGVAPDGVAGGFGEVAVEAAELAVGAHAGPGVEHGEIAAGFVADDFEGGFGLDGGFGGGVCGGAAGFVALAEGEGGAGVVLKRGLHESGDADGHGEGGVVVEGGGGAFEAELADKGVGLVEGLLLALDGEGGDGGGAERIGEAVVGLDALAKLALAGLAFEGFGEGGFAGGEAGVGVKVGAGSDLGVLLGGLPGFRKEAADGGAEAAEHFFGPTAKGGEAFGDELGSFDGVGGEQRGVKAHRHLALSLGDGLVCPGGEFGVDVA